MAESELPDGIRHNGYTYPGGAEPCYDGCAGCVYMAGVQAGREAAAADIGWFADNAPFEADEMILRDAQLIAEHGQGIVRRGIARGDNQEASGGT